MTSISGRTIALPLSVVLHAAVLYTVGRAPWVVAEARASPSLPAPVVWLEMRAREPPIEPAPAPQASPGTIAPRDLDPAPRERPPEPAVAERVSETPILPVEPAPAVTDLSPSRPAPRIDWEKERRNAAAAVIEDREHRTFSLDDLEKPQALPVEPAPPPMVADNCVVAGNRLARFAAQMIGRCVRDARADLFAAIRRGYLETRPVCAETRPESPGTVTSRGEVISTVKCELVVDE